MAAITDYIFDTTFIEETLEYLQTEHGICAALVDSGGQRLAVGATLAADLPARKIYPFAAPHDVGGLECGAQSDAVIQKAEPHILHCTKAFSTLLQREIELQETTNEILQLSSELNFLYKMASKLIGINKLDDCYQVVLEEIASAVKAGRAFVKTRGRWDKELTVTCGLSSVELDRLTKQQSFQDAAKDHTIIFSLEDNSSVLLCPIKEKEGSIGYMGFLKGKDSRFSAYEKKFVSIIENIISPNIETMRLYDSLQDLYLNTVKALAAAIDAKDEYTHGHSFRVAQYSVTIGNKMGLSEKELADLEIAAYMHDLGKIGVPESILGKPGKLSAEEFAQIKMHPVYTDKILQPINLPEFIVNAAVHHHERLDGSGYPHGLQGDKISPFARIIAVADVFDALTSDRPYRSSMPVETALEELCKLVDRELDRKVVLALISTLQDTQQARKLIKIYPNLKFSDITRLNQFLLGLIQFIHPDGILEIKLNQEEYPAENTMTVLRKSAEN